MADPDKKLKQIGRDAGAPVSEEEPNESRPDAPPEPSEKPLPPAKETPAPTEPNESVPPDPPAPSEKPLPPAESSPSEPPAPKPAPPAPSSPAPVQAPDTAPKQIEQKAPAPPAPPAPTAPVQSLREKVASQPTEAPAAPPPTTSSPENPAQPVGVTTPLSRQAYDREPSLMGGFVEPPAQPDYSPIIGVPVPAESVSSIPEEPNMTPAPPPPPPPNPIVGPPESIDKGESEPVLPATPQEEGPHGPMSVFIGGNGYLVGNNELEQPAALPVPSGATPAVPGVPQIELGSAENVVLDPLPNTDATPGTTPGVPQVEIGQAEHLVLGPQARPNTNPTPGTKTGPQYRKKSLEEQQRDYRELINRPVAVSDKQEDTGLAIVGPMAMNALLSQHPNRFFMKDLNTAIEVYAQYNPPDFSDEVQVDYARLEPPGASYSRLHYKSTKNYIVELELYWTVYDKDTFELAQRARHILWSWCYPDRQTNAYRDALQGGISSGPPVLFAMWPHLFVMPRCRLLGMKMNYMRFAQQGWPTRWVSTVRLEECRDAFSSGQDIRAEQQAAMYLDPGSTHQQAT